MRHALPVLVLWGGLICGGCTVTVDDDPPEPGPAASAPAAPQDALRTHEVHLDLRTPPARALFGIVPPAQSTTIDRGTGPVLDVDLQLPERTRLHTAAVEVSAAYDGSLPTVYVATAYPDLPTARTQLVPVLTALGLPTGDVDRLDRLTPGTLDTTSVVDTRRGYLSVFGQVRLNGSDPRVDVSYTLSWEPSATPGT